VEFKTLPPKFLRAIEQRVMLQRQEYGPPPEACADAAHVRWHVNDRENASITRKMWFVANESRNAGIRLRGVKDLMPDTIPDGDHPITCYGYSGQISSSQDTQSDQPFFKFAFVEVDVHGLRASISLDCLADQLLQLCHVEWIRSLPNDFQNEADPSLDSSAATLKPSYVKFTVTGSGRERVRKPSTSEKFAQ
jgi:hypothetical protein